MCKNYLLSYTAAAAIVLFSAHFNAAVAENMDQYKGEEVDAGENKTYQAPSDGKSALHVGEKSEDGEESNDKKGGKITGKDLTLIGTEEKKGKGTTVDGSDSEIILKGKTTIKDLDIGVSATKGGKITMESGTIDVSDTAIKAEDENTIITLGNVDITSQKTGIDIKNGAEITMESGTINAKEAAIKAENENTIITLGNVDITSQGIGIDIKNGAKILANGASVTFKNDKEDNADKVAISAHGNGSSITSNDVVISSDASGIKISEKAILNMTGGSIVAKKDGIVFDGNENDESKIKNVKITVEEGSGLLAKNSKVSLENISIKSKKGFGLYASGNKTDVTIEGGIIDANNAAFFVENSSKINISNVSAKASANGLEFRNNDEQGAVVNFINTKLAVEKGVGIFGNESGKDIVNLKNSEIRADLLLKSTAKEEKKSVLTLNADHSLLEGGVRTGEETETVFNLNNGTIWTLKISKEEKNDENKLLDLGDRARSFVSKLDLNNSTIAFDKSTEGQYQTLYVGPVIPEVIDNRRDANNPSKVYNAQGNAKIYFNTEWISGLKIKDQKTDRLVINGDASGTTTVYVNIIKGNNKTEENTSVPENENGISLIQVSGKANKDSFKLAHGYTTIKGVPYKYTLNAYDPKASSHKADQSMFGPDTPYWDFRLQNAYLDSQSKVKALVPQMASYLVMPNALFSVGFSDIGEQNKALTNMRTISLENDNNKKNTFFLSSYGSTVTLSSNHSALEYGYGANIRYGGVQAGVALGALENQNTITRFGLLGTYGQVSFTPKDMEGAVKSTLDKWSVSAFGSMQYRNGLYLDTLFSYGLVKGHIKVADIGNIAKLDNVNTLSASATIGQQFTTSIQGLTFEPQAQLAYQSLIFDNISDGNDLEINMNNPHQWLVRIGGRLTKTVTAVENGRAISLYGKLNMINTFGDDNTIQVSDSFHLDPMGASVEGGVGINAQLNQKIGLHGDVSHQHKLQKAGVSATSFSGGIRYRF
ncbi:MULTISPECIES: autotransporter family protein [unclassified Bartonella]|uniref:autotransporter family protein n=1 Tax=unclassified Bartonella TaxID=2645622 RepID=UPI00099AE923|nr:MULTISPECIES: autotransporter outer membrane beta-barrel domain-containing protein [unclassified Bartonella]AQX27738.1 outer membrane autotransporter barrel domain-containing protein [Bartonella sp. JB15]AQX29020.1 outer membrane autotransporter barrel domain-containing protein [Bartonella sp. JB63]